MKNLNPSLKFLTLLLIPNIIIASEESPSFADFHYIVEVRSFDPGDLISTMDSPDTDGEFEFYVDTTLVLQDRLSGNDISLHDIELDIERIVDVPTRGDSRIEVLDFFDPEEVPNLPLGVHPWKPALSLVPSEWGKGKQEWEHSKLRVNLDDFPVSTPLVAELWDLPLDRGYNDNGYFGTAINSGRRNLPTWSRTTVALQRTPKSPAIRERATPAGSFSKYIEEWWAQKDIPFRSWLARKTLLERALKYAGKSPRARVSSFWAEKVRERIDQKHRQDDLKKRFDYLVTIAEQTQISEEAYFRLLEILDPQNLFGLRLAKLDEETPSFPFKKPETDQDFILWFVANHEKAVEEENP